MTDYPCAAGWCSARVAAPELLCPRHRAQAQEHPGDGDRVRLKLWGWRQVGDGPLWEEPSRKYVAHWRIALHRIARDEERGDRP